MALIHLLLKVKIKSVLCFAKSVESAHRLTQLLQLFFEKIAENENKLSVSEYSSDLTPAQRSSVFKKFTNGSISVLVCSDMVARGVDIENVDTVINYDVPISINQYIHRVGRTARAGKEGTAYSLISSHEARYFRQMNHDCNRMDKLKQINLKSNDFEPYLERYQECLDGLKDVYLSKYE
ncbi:ATP-dependent RNA helicase dbp6 [Smittium culicis]|nr:ATP-dependent RNA helicase dbp6 [Smittium culicis]